MCLLNENDLYIHVQRHHFKSNIVSSRFGGMGDINKPKIKITYCHIYLSQYYFTECRAYSKNERDIRSHNKNMHYAVKINCLKCEMSFTSNHAMNMHIHQDHQKYIENTDNNRYYWKETSKVPPRNITNKRSAAFQGQSNQRDFSKQNRGHYEYDYEYDFPVYSRFSSLHLNC